MNKLLDSVRHAYAEQVRKFGEDPRATFQNDLLTMHLRYAHLLANLGAGNDEGSFSIYDVGCGTCELHEIGRAHV